MNVTYFDRAMLGLSVGRRFLGGAIAAMGCVVMVPAIAQAQVSEAEMQGFSMPPARGYDFTRSRCGWIFDRGLFRR
jgi:hypothetical protein